MPKKCSEVDGIRKLNIRYTVVVMATNCDIIMASSVVKNRIWSNSKMFFLSGLFLAVLLTYISYIKKWYLTVYKRWRCNFKQRGRWRCKITRFISKNETADKYGVTVNCVHEMKVLQCSKVFCIIYSKLDLSKSDGIWHIYSWRRLGKVVDVIRTTANECFRFSYSGFECETIHRLCFG